MRLESAIATHIANALPDLHMFRDDLAWNAAGNPYPYLLISEISRDRRSLGTGRFDGYQGGGTPVKLIKERRVLRFTLRTAGTRQKSGGRLASDLADQAIDLLDSLCRTASVDLPVPDSSETVHVERAVYVSRNDLPPMENGEPFVHQVAFSYAFTIHRVLEGELVTSAVNELIIEKG